MSTLENPERGSVPLEAVLITPAFLLFLALILFAGRLAITTQSVESAASDAARAASIERTRAGAEAAARAAAASSLEAQGLPCVSTSVVVDTSGFAAAVGTPASVRATVSCELGLADLALPGVPGTKRVSASMLSALDTFRER